MSRDKVKFKVVIPMYNISKWIEKTVGSIMEQKYKNFEAIIIDDISTDNSFELVHELTKDDDRFTVIKNTEKKFALRNIYEGIERLSPDPDDIIVTLDGDDWLATPLVLAKLAQFYSRNDCWLTYGSYMEYPSGIRGPFAKQIPSHVVESASYRTHEWCSSHLRTFKYGLWSEINRDDLLDKEGNFYRMAWDLAFMLPMLEMSGERAMHIPDMLYVYNVGNPLNDHKVDNSYQIRLEHEIRSKPKYSRLKDEE